MYNDNPDLISFNFPKPIQPTDALDILLNVTPDKVCKRKPVGVVKPGAFVVATDQLGNSDDLKADDLGVWAHKGKPTRLYKVTRTEEGIVYGADITKQAGESVYRLTRVYYHHKHTPSFRRTLFYVSGKLHKI